MSKGLSYAYSGTTGHITQIASTLPNNPHDLLNNGWEDITHPGAKNSGHLELQEKTTGLKIRFDKGDPNGNGFAQKDHYHILNPNAKSNKDLYLDKDGNPVRKGSKKSHILPNGGN